MRKHFAIFRTNGTVAYYSPAPNNPNEYPPAHGLSPDSVGVEIVEVTEDLSARPDDYRAISARLESLEFREGQLHPKGGGPALNAVCAEKFRLRGGILEENTAAGWKVRAIFEPFVDDDGQEVEGPDGMPEGQWYVMGPRRPDGKPNLIEIDEPGPDDRRVWKGPRGHEIEPESPTGPDE